MADNDLHSEKELFRQIAEGSHGAFKMLLKRYRNTVFSHAMAYVKDRFKAKDITQEVFFAIWSGRETLSTVDNPEAYLFILTRNKIVAEFRTKIKLSVLDNLERIKIDPAPLPDRLLESRQLSSLIRSAMDQMPPQRKIVFQLGKLDGLAYEQIAEQLHISPSTVRNHMIQALSFIRSFIRNAGIISLILTFFLKGLDLFSSICYFIL